MLGGGWGGFWPVLLVIPVMMLIGMVVMVRTMRGGGHSSCGPMGWRPTIRGGGVPDETEMSGPDPLVVLRERYATGAISHEEFERRVEALLRTDPNQDRPVS
ncbi:MAG: SHOCT domain-containing protein [Candidatus Dormibacteria bacterium]